MEYYFGILNRTFLIFITPNMIAGGFVHGIMAAWPYQPDYWFEPMIYAKEMFIKKYEQIDPESETFAQLAPFNFQYARSDVTNSYFDPSHKWGMGSVAHSGKLYIEFISDKTREFILLGLQQGHEILNHLRTRNIDELNSQTDTELSNLLLEIYKQPKNRDLWIKLTTLFIQRGETAQAFYCYLQVKRLT